MTAFSSMVMVTHKIFNLLNISKFVIEINVWTLQTKYIAEESNEALNN